MPLVVLAAALLIGVYAVGTDLGSSGAAECNAGINSGGTLGSGKTSTFRLTFCSDLSHSFGVRVSWKQFSPARDLALRVTAPDGRQWYVDDHDDTVERFGMSAPIPEGDWTVEVINHGARSVNYDVVAGFG
jgi:hypothetical protein